MLKLEHRHSYTEKGVRIEKKAEKFPKNEKESFENVLQFSMEWALGWMDFNRSVFKYWFLQLRTMKCQSMYVGTRLRVIWHF